MDVEIEESNLSDEIITKSLIQIDGPLPDSSCPDRILMLPIGRKDRQTHQELRNLGIKCVISSDEFKIWAKLPDRWSVKYETEENQEGLTLFDTDNLPRVKISKKSGGQDQAGTVIILPKVPITPQVPIPPKEKSKNKSRNNGELDIQFCGLRSSYKISVVSNAGKGQKGRIQIDRAWRKLDDFVREHPEFKKAVPPKARLYNDGTGGYRIAIEEGKPESSLNSSCVLQ